MFLKQKKATMNEIGVFYSVSMPNINTKLLKADVVAVVL